MNTNQNSRKLAKPSTEPPISTSDELIGRVFAKMRSIYLNAWTSNFRTEQDVKAAMNTWGEELADLHIDQIARALKVCASRPGWPPTLGEFKRLAVGIPSRREIGGMVYGRSQHPLAVKIRRGIGSFALDTLSVEAIERQIGALYDDLYADCLVELSGQSDKQLEYQA